MLTALNPEDVAPLAIGPGCWRRDLPAAGGVRVWIVDIEPGYAWPYVDQHDAKGEEVLVLSGEMIEGEQRFGPGTYIVYGPDSAHQPRTETGVRLYGINVT